MTLHLYRLLIITMLTIFLQIDLLCGMILRRISHDFMYDFDEGKKSGGKAIKENVLYVSRVHHYRIFAQRYVTV